MEGDRFRDSRLQAARTKTADPSLSAGYKATATNHSVLTNQVDGSCPPRVASTLGTL